MQYGLLGLFVLSGLITVRALHVMTGITVEVRHVQKNSETLTERLEKVKNYAIEAMVLVVLLMAILAVVFLFAHEGVM